MKNKIDAPKAKKEDSRKKLKKVSFNENLIQGPSPYGFGTETSSAQGGDSFSIEKFESREEADNRKSLDDYCLSRDEEKSNDKPSSKENQRFDGFKKYLEVCIESFSNSDYATSLDEDASTIGFKFKVSDAEIKSIITEVKKEDVSNKMHTTTNLLEQLKESAPDQKLQRCCELLILH